jgi:hypothetical protein
MPRAEKPSSPLQELAARRSWTGPTLPGGVLTTELADFCQSGVSVVVASCDRTALPLVGRALACRIAPDGEMRVVLRESSNLRLLDALRDGARLAVTFTQPTTHRSIQLKAPGARLVAANASDAPAAIVQTAAFRRELMEIGYDDTFAAGYCGFETHDLVTITFRPEQAFVQTPGPSAGSALQ